MRAFFIGTLQRQGKFIDKRKCKISSYLPELNFKFKCYTRDRQWIIMAAYELFHSKCQGGGGREGGSLVFCSPFYSFHPYQCVLLTHSLLLLFKLCVLLEKIYPGCALLSGFINQILSVTKKGRDVGRGLEGGRGGGKGRGEWMSV